MDIDLIPGIGPVVELIVYVVVVLGGGAGAAALLGRSGGGDEDRGGGTAVRERPAEAPPRPETEVDTPPVDEVYAAPEVAPAPEAPPEPVAPAPPVEPEVEELTLRERFTQRLARTRNVLGANVAEIFGRGVDEAAWEALEEALISADVGVNATMEIVEELRARAKQEGATDADAVLALLKDELRRALGTADRSLARATDDEPTVWLVTGVNGTGKTTTIGKLAALEGRNGNSVVLAAADTFRAAAAEQLGLWAERTGARLVRKDEGADPAAVAVAGYNAPKAPDAAQVIVDTAGRLHNKRELMDELSKVKRVVEKQAGPLEETLLVLDATTGQNGIAQAKAFLDAVDVTGLVLTKLDGSSKGGIVIAVQRELDLPVKLVGLGEDVDDLAPFDPDAFVEGLFAEL
jgi:fused signal recognition particle receptor